MLGAKTFVDRVRPGSARHVVRDHPAAGDGDVLSSFSCRPSRFCDGHIRHEHDDGARLRPGGWRHHHRCTELALYLLRAAAPDHDCLGARFGLHAVGSSERTAEIRLGGLFANLHHLVLPRERFVERTETGWLSDHISGLLAITVVGAVAFLWSQSKAQDPLLDLSLFRNPAFASACMIAFIFGMGNFATTYAVPVFGQLVQGMSATDAGMLMMPAGLIVAFALPFTGRLADRSKPHYIIICGLFFFFLGTALLGGADANTPYWHVAFFGMVSRFGMSFIMPSVMSTALKSVSSEQLNRAGGAVNFIRQLGGSLGTNFYVVLLSLRTQFHSDALASTQISGNAASQELLVGVGSILNAAGVPEAVHQSGALHYLGQVVHAQASTMGFQDGFLIIAAVFLAAMVPAWILGRAQAVRR